MKAKLGMVNTTANYNREKLAGSSTKGQYTDLNSIPHGEGNKLALGAALTGGILTADALVGSNWLNKLKAKYRARKNSNSSLKKHAGLSPASKKILKDALRTGGVAAGAVALAGAPLAIWHYYRNRKDLQAVGLHGGLILTGQQMSGRATNAMLSLHILPKTLTMGQVPSSKVQEAGAKLIGGSVTTGVGMSLPSLGYPTFRAAGLSTSGLKGTPIGPLIPEKWNDKVKSYAPWLTLGGATAGVGALVGSGRYVYDKYYKLPIISSMTRSDLEEEREAQKLLKKHMSGKKMLGLGLLASLGAVGVAEGVRAMYHLATKPSTHKKSNTKERKI